MKTHDEYISSIQLFVDNELAGGERKDLLDHLEGCVFCQQVLEDAETFSDRVRQARPHVVASAALRERVLKELNSPANNIVGLDEGVTAPSAMKLGSHLFHWKPLAVAAILCITFGGVLSVPVLQRASRAERFIAVAVADHYSSADDSSLDVRSNSPQVVAAWFAQRVSFPFRIPDEGIASDDRAKYTLVGGRLVDFGGERAALLVFRLPHDRISLLVSSDKLARATGGRIVRSGELSFHVKESGNLHVATWDNKGLTYALISNVAMGNSHGCSTCHRDSAAAPGLRESTSLRHEGRRDQTAPALGDGELKRMILASMDQRQTLF
jgi:anti-sigma factor RsiW